MAEPKDEGGGARSSMNGRGSKKGAESPKATVVSVKGMQRSLASRRKVNFRGLPGEPVSVT